MKQIFTIALFFIFCGGYAQTARLYNPEADVAAAITQGLAQAKAENKQLFLQIGGNWCPWCIKFHKFCSDDKEISALLSKSYVVLKVNYSKENRNLAELKKLEYPQRFGFPVFVVLNNDGKRIHTQSSGILEDGDSYSKKRVLDFLTQWSTDVLNPELYKAK
jgi:thioredoxin-related protein